MSKQDTCLKLKMKPKIHGFGVWKVALILLVADGFILKQPEFEGSRHVFVPRLPKHHMMVDVAVLAASDSEEDLQRDAKVLLSQPHIRSVAVFEPRGVGLDESRAGVRHVAGDPNLEIIYKVGRGSQSGSASFPVQLRGLLGRFLIIKHVIFPTDA